MIYKTDSAGDLAGELLRKDNKLKADYVGQSFEGDIVEKIKAKLTER